MDKYSSTLDTIDFITDKINTIKEDNKDKKYLEIKDISDIQRYAKTLMSLSKYALNMKEVSKYGN